MAGWLVSSEEMRQLDRQVIEQIGVPGVVLMDAAGRGVADLIVRIVDVPRARVVVYAGAGNNGGDGFVAARHLANRGATVQVVLCAPAAKVTGDAHTHLYAVNEQTAGQVASFAIDQASGALTHLNDVSSGGNGPAHVSVDHSGKWVMAANYGDGTIGVWPVQPDGSLGAPSDTRAAGANAHQIVASLSNLVVFVPCLGAGYVAQFTFDASSGKLTPNPVPHVTTPAGAGPRHLAFHPNGTIAYLIAETNSTISAYHLDGAGQLTSMQTVSTLPPVFTGTNTAAEIWVHPSGKFLYGSNRGDDSIAIFTLDAAGMMTAKAFPKSGGQNPRDFTLDPTGQWLLVANQGSGSLDVFRIDATTGLLTPSGSVTVSMPSFVGVVTLPGS